MALVWTESAQRLESDTGAYFADYFAWNGIFAPSWAATGGRNNGPSIAGVGVAYPTRPTPSGSTYICGVRYSPAIGVQQPIMAACWSPTGANLNVTANPQVSLVLEANGALSVYSGGSSGTLLAQTAAGVIVSGVRAFVMKAVIDGAAGTIDVWVDGLPVAALSGLTGKNTKPQAGGLWNAFLTPGFDPNTGHFGWCDLYVLDGTNPTGNDPHAPILDARVDYRKPTGNGTYSQFTGQDGDSVNNYLNVADAPDDGDTTYNQAAATAKDSYLVQHTPVAGSTVYGVTAFMVTRKTDAAVVTGKVGVRSGGADYLGTDEAFPTTYQTYRNHLGVDPNGNLAWTEAGFNAIEVLVSHD